jgi:adenylate cyclase
MKHSRVLHGFAALSTAMFLLLQLFDPPVLREHLETMTYDLRLYVKTIVKRHAMKDSSPPEDILIVTVDEKSISEVGRWPWGRDMMSRLVGKISAGKPKVIGVDILFTEPESEEADTGLAGALDEAGNAVLATGFLSAAKGDKQDTAEVDYLWDHAFMSVKSTQDINWKSWVVKPDSALAPIEGLANASTLGSVFTQPDRDGVLRWEILYLYYDEDFYPSFALQVARIAKGVSMEDMSLHGGSGIMLGDEHLPTDLHGRVLIDYLGREGCFAYIPAVDVMEGRVKPGVFTDKVVLVGTTALGTYDLKVTPLSVSMPGIEKNAAVVENILRGRFMRKSPGIMEMVITLITAIILSLLLRRMRALWGTAVTFLLVGLYIVFSFYLFINNFLWINLSYPVLNMLGIFVFQTTAKFFFEEMKAKNIRRMFTSYVSPAVVEALMNNPHMAKLGGERKEVTVLFSDIVGFTGISEKLEPEEVVSMLNEYFKEMTDVIFKWQGTFDKIVGDEIMAFWGAPVKQPNHAELASRCALDMFKTLGNLQKKWAGEGRPVLDCGIGVNTGEVLVGNIGAEDKKMDYTVIGDHVNTGARVEALTREYNAKILVTEYTAENLQRLIDEKALGHARLIFRDFVKLKGKAQPIGIYELTDTEMDL